MLFFSRPKNASQKALKDLPQAGPISGLDALLSLDEAKIAEAFPSLGKVKDIFQRQLKTQGDDPIEADPRRHIRGSREATLEAGFFPTLIGGIGHELNLLQNSVRGIGLPGSDLKTQTPGRLAAESGQDFINNAIGQGQALSMLLGLSPSPETPSSDKGVSIDRPGTLTARFGSGLENIVNELLGVHDDESQSEGVEKPRSR
jgi:hypothetical protein